MPAPDPEDTAAYPCVQGLIAANVALMTAYAHPTPDARLDAEAQRRLLARKVVSNLFFLCEHPLLSPGLSSRWLSLVTDVDAEAGRNLVDSMSIEVIVEDDSIRDVVPFEPMGYDDAVRTALAEHRSRR